MEFDPATREQILDAAEARFRHYGFAKTTMAEIASDCGMSAGNIYRFFENKAEICVSIAHRCMGRLEAVAREAAERADLEPAEKLEALVVDMATENFRRFETDSRLDELVAYMTEHRFDAIQPHIEAVKAQITRILAEGNVSGAFSVADPDATAFTVLLAAKGVIHPLLMQKDEREAFESQTRAVVRLVIDGLRAR